MSGRFKRPTAVPHNRAQLTKAVVELRADVDDLGGTLLPKLAEGLEFEIKQSLAHTGHAHKEFTDFRDMPWYARWRWLLTGRL